MTDTTHRDDGIPVGAALRALPLERPDAGAWPRLASELAHLPTRRQRRARLRPLLALAATVALAALLLPRLPQAPYAPSSDTVATATPTTAAADTAAAAAAAGITDDALPRLVRESATLEALLAATSDQQVASASSLLLREHLTERVQFLDALLADPDTAPQAELVLWQERVLLLRGLAGLEGGEQVLAAQGHGGDAALVLTL